jgi:hypothetical protein
MKTLPCHPSFPSRAGSSILPFLAVALLLGGCVSSRYEEAPKKTPPPQMLNVAFAPAPLQATLKTVITYNGPGSWKKNSFWDEYVVTLHNPGQQPLVVSAATLTDFAGTPLSPGSDPWALEKQSKTLEQKYRSAGVAFVRYTAPAVLIVGAGIAIISDVGIFSAAAGTAAAATLVALPLYYATVLTMNHYNKVDMEKEFNRRRLALPLTLEPGDKVTGSLFFPMVPNPRSLGLHWSTDTGSGEAVLPLDFLHGLHVKQAESSAPPTPKP